MLSVAIRGIAGIVFGLLGLIGLFSPDRTRALTTTFLEKTPVRILGAVLIILGAGIFRVAMQLHVPLAGQLVGVALFMLGGVHIVIPEFAIIVNEWWVARKTVWERLISLVYIALAVLFFTPQGGFPKFWQTREPLPQELRQSPPRPDEAEPPENAGETAPEEAEASDAPPRLTIRHNTPSNRQTRAQNPDTPPDNPEKPVVEPPENQSRTPRFS